jgi:maltokinase
LVSVSDVRELLVGWVPRQRWFAGKGRPLADVRVRSDVALSDLLRHLVVEVTYDDGGPAESYQVPLVVRQDAPFGHDGFLLGESTDGLVYDGLHDPAGSAVLLELMAGGAERDGLRFVPLAQLSARPPHAVGAEQSNTSVIYGEAYILKVIRRLWPGVNPDLEVTKALADLDSPHAPRPLGWIETDLGGEPTTLAVLHEYLRSGTEGWRLATASVRDLYAELDLHADEVGGDFAGESERLGHATAVVHRQMAQALPTGVAGPGDLREAAGQMHSRLDAACAAVEELREFEASLRKIYDALAAHESLVHIQRIHGDYHLGQVLRVDAGWVLLDFEGEPARPLSERTALMSPLRDVAGMLRSFDYAARFMLLERRDEPPLVYRAQEWTDRNRDAFCDGYTAGTGRDPRGDGTLLRAFELDKAVYEVVYEARHRPSWLPIPLGSVERLAQAA